MSSIVKVQRGAAEVFGSFVNGGRALALRAAGMAPFPELDTEQEETR